MLDQMSYWETWEPFREIRQLQEDMYRNFYDRSEASFSNHLPLLNVWSGQDRLVVRCELPGFSPEDINVSVVRQELTIKGSIKPHEAKESERFIRSERYHGDLFRTVKLPYRVDTNQTEAQLKNGVLTITLKRPHEDKPRKITVKSE